jgi:hypothetical protein
MKTPVFKIIVLLLFYGLVCSCESKSKDSGANQYLKKIELQRVANLKLSTEDGLNFFNHSISNYKGRKGETISILNPNKNIIHLFNGIDGEKLKNINLELDGPNGVGGLGMVSSHLIHNLDSIFIYNLQTGILFLVDEKGQKINQYLVTDYTDEINFPAPFPSTITPFYFFDGKIYMSCGINNYSDKFVEYPSSLVLDLDSKKISYNSTFPPKYDEAFWGITFKYDAGITVNHVEKKILFNFPIDNWVYSQDLESKSNPEKKLANSIYFEEHKAFDPNPEKYKSIDFSTKNIPLEHHAFSNSDYAGILFDPNNQVYYRIAFIRPNIADVEEGNRVPDISIITLDRNLKKIGEDLFLGKTYDNTMIFVTSRGLNIARKDLYSKDENYLEFEVFSPKEIQSSNVK